MISSEDRERAVAATAELAEVINIQRSAKIIDSPGIYKLDHDAYHGDPVDGGSLSCSGAKILLPPGCPAKFRWFRDHPEERQTKPVFEFGQGAHTILLGIGPELVEVPGDWRTKTAQTMLHEARSEGAVPLHTQDFQRIYGMVDALRDHPKLGRLFDHLRETGRTEQSIFWHDHKTKVMRRARADAMTEPSNGRVIIIDYKTARSAYPSDFARATYNLAYEMSAAWYSEGVRAVLGVDTEFLFVAQEKEKPYLITTAYLDPEFMSRGQKLVRKAVDLYAECVRNNRWPGYTDDEPIMIYPPAWAQEVE